MSVARSILMRMFGRPKGLLGKLGGVIMARMNYDCATWVIQLLHIQPNDKVLEVGFGPGVGIQLLAGLASTGELILPKKWLRKLRSETPGRNRVSTSGTAPPRACRSKTICSIRPWQLTPCRSGRTLWLDCKRFGGS